MDDYENIFNGAGSAPTAAGGAASLGPDAAGYAPTAAATPTPMSAAEAAKYDKIPVGLYPESPAARPSPVDSLAPQAMEQMKIALSLGASELSPANRQRWMPSNAQLAAFGLSPVSPSRNLSDGVFTQGGAQRPLPEWAKQSPEELLREFYRDRFIQRWFGAQKTPNTLTEALGGGESIKTLAESLRGGAQKGIEDFYRGREPGGSASVSMPAYESRPVKMPTVDERQLSAPLEDSRRPVGNRYEYRGYQAELPSGVDLGDPAAVSRATAMNNMLIDWMFDNDEEEV